jgi:hypothetical protein
LGAKSFLFLASENFQLHDDGVLRPEGVDTTSTWVGAEPLIRVH